MSKEAVHLPVMQPSPAGLGTTLRKDAWWVGPLVTGIVLASFIVYATFRAFENAHYAIDPYLSPFYSPFIPTAGFGIAFFSPAMLILPGPASFRLTCYYYRKAYYRAFAMDPPACAVGENRGHQYNGETKLLLFQNLHRYALYIAIVFLAFLWGDFFRSLSWSDGHGGRTFGMGMGSLVLLANDVLLSLYTFSCHSMRHLVGGRIDSYSTEPFGKLRHAIWHTLSKLNVNHMAYAWMSLFGVGLTDFYVRCVSIGCIHDIRFF